MGIKKATIDEALAYARERAQSIGSIQRIIEVDGGYRVGSEKRMDFFYSESLGYTIYPIY